MIGIPLRSQSAISNDKSTQLHGYSWNQLDISPREIIINIFKYKKLLLFFFVMYQGIL